MLNDENLKKKAIKYKLRIKKPLENTSETKAYFLKVSLAEKKNFRQKKALSIIKSIYPQYKLIPEANFYYKGKTYSKWKKRLLTVIQPQN